MRIMQRCTYHYYTSTSTVHTCPSTYQEYRFLRNLIYRRVEDLQRNGDHIKLIWVSGHSEVLGNEKAHLKARRRAEKGGKLVERWSSLAYVRKNVDKIRSRAVAHWHETEISEREASRRGFYIPRTKGISVVLGKAPKKNTPHDFTNLKLDTGQSGII